MFQKWLGVDIESSEMPLFVYLRRFSILDQLKRFYFKIAREKLTTAYITQPIKMYCHLFGSGFFFFTNNDLKDVLTLISNEYQLTHSTH